MTHPHASSGADVARDRPALDGLEHWVAMTGAFRPELMGPHAGQSGLATVLDIGGGRGLALATRGVGAKRAVAQLAGRYDTLGIDCVAMSANDVVCVGAEPVAMLPYCAIDHVHAGMAEAIGKGLYEGAKQAGIAIVGGESGQGCDVAGTCVGLVALDQVIDGSRVRPGDLVIGLASSGVHASGLTLARAALLTGTDADGRVVPELETDVTSALLTPTRIYVKPILALVRALGADVKALLHITGGGLLDLTRVRAHVGFVLDAMPAPPPIFELIRRAGVATSDLYAALNMGIGLCAVVAPSAVDRALNVLASHSEIARVIGRATDDTSRAVHIPAAGLVGVGQAFREQ